jgi:hypothetical protein
MSTIKNKSDLGGVLGERVALQKVGGRVIATNRPKRKLVKTSAAHEASMAKFVRASKYANYHANLALTNQPTPYTEGIKGKKRSVYAVAMSDRLTPPKVQDIDAPKYKGATGSSIHVWATDDFRVASVEVTIIDGNGTELETGQALPLPQDPELFVYKTRVENLAVPGSMIRATATDVANNSTTSEKAL